MKPSPLRFHRPATLDEALALLADLGADAKVLAGGQSLVPMLSMRLAAPANIVDITAIPGIDEVTAGPDGVTFGALVTHTALLSHDGAAGHQPLLRRALRNVAHPTIRNRGTTLGSIVHADPSAEMPAVMVLLGGTVTVASAAGGERLIAASDLFLGPLESSLEPTEIALQGSVPARRGGVGTAVEELARRHGDYAMAGVVALVEATEGVVRAARATFVSAGELGEVVDLDAATGLPVDAPPDAWAVVADQARDLVLTDDDVHATAAYRSHLVGVLTARAVARAAVDATDPTTQERAA